MKVAGTFYWSYFAKTNDMSGQYQFDFGNLSEKAVEALKEIGLNPRQKDDKGFFLTFKSKYPIEVFDADGEVISDRDGVTKKIVANGSEGVVTVGYYDWEFKGKKGRSPSAKRVVVTHLVEYNKDEPSDDIPV